MKLYLKAGRAVLVCPARKLEPHPSGNGEHSPEPHAEITFVWQVGSEHIDHHGAEIACYCGRQLVHHRGDDPHAAPWVEVEGTPHGD